jgi:cytochrome b561
MLESWINIHALFGTLLCGLVLARCQWWVKHSRRMGRADVRKLSRHLSRIVYLLLYVVIGVRVFIGILDGVWHGVGADFSLFGHGPDFEWFNTRDDFQLFFASGLFALVFVRVLALRLWWRCVQYRNPGDGPLA